MEWLSKGFSYYSVKATYHGNVLYIYEKVTAFSTWGRLLAMNFKKRAGL